MHLTKRFHVLSLAAVAAAMLALPSAASADTGHCVFEGVAGNITPGVMLQGGSGTYDFQTVDPLRTQCSYNGGAPAPSKIVSAGSFSNVVCGTGTADATSAAATWIDQGNNGTKDISSATYHIDFRGAQGQLNILTVNGRADTLPSNGHVTIVPTGGSCAAATGVTQFEVAGVLTASW